MATVLTYGSETRIWREKERSRIRAEHMENHRGLLGIRGMNKVPNARRQLCGMTKGVDEKIDEGVERMENDSITKRVYEGESAGSRSVGRAWKR